MKKTTNNSFRVLVLVLFLMFIGFGSLHAQFSMGNTLAPLAGNPYPIVYSNDVMGGYHQVATIAARNAIPALRRQAGMLCTVLDAGSGTPKTYQLLGGILDVNWVEFASGTTSIETDPIVKAINGIVKSNGSTISAAAAGTDYLTPAGSAALLTNFPTLNQNTTGNATTATTATNWSGSGALASYLPLTGGILTGTLTGTSAAFSSTATSTGFIKSGGTASQFLKADGSIDASTYLTSSSGVGSITGTANQITASASTGAITLSLPTTINGLTSVTSTGFTGALTGNASGTSANVTGIVAATNGGTGVTTVAAEQTRLGLGTMAYASTGSYALTAGTNATGTWPVNITGNASGTSANVTGIVAATNGGTGVTTVAAEQTRLGLGTMAYAATGSYALTTGTNATGTWPIGITGNAATASSLANFISNPNRNDGNDYSLAARTSGVYAIAGVGTNGPGSNYSCLIHVANASDVAFQIAGGYTSDNMYFRGTSGLQNGTGYTPWRTVLHSGNYNSYSPTLTGGNASGTWGINITGNAGSASSVAWANVSGKPSLDFATHRGEGTNYVDYSRYVYNNGAYSGSGWTEPSDLGVRYAASAGSANAVSWSNVSGGTSWGTYYIGSNKGSGSYVGGQNNYGLMVYSNDGGAAGMSFHRGGSFALNMGLDPDNVFRIGGWSAAANLFQLDMSGNLTLSGNVTAYSDIRLKKNIRTLSPVSASLRKINAVEYDRKDISLHQLGFIAQNVQQYFPDLVTVAKDSMATLSLNYQAMTAPLLKGWQEHDVIIEKQQGEIEGLTKEIALLKESIEELKKTITAKK